jgi:hypothetical protein
MHKIVLYTKSYSGDLARLNVLIESIKKHNKDNIPYYISVPANEINLFKNSIDCSYVILVTDEEIYKVSTQNWNTQQIVKSNFWKLNVCENYVMLDSDSYFIKDFYISDFMYNDKTPYTVMHEQKDLFAWTAKFGQSILGFNPYQSFKQDRLRIMEIFGRNGRIYDFGPGPIIWSSKVWQSLETDYLQPNNLQFETLIEFCPSEFSWYGEWLLSSKIIDLIPIEPIFKFFHYEQLYQYYKQLGFSEIDFTEQYMGIVMQSNWNAPLSY